MAKRSFSEDDFNKAAGDVASGKGQGDGEFPVISKGTYVAHVERAAFKQADSGSEQVSIGFQIDEDDDNHANQYVFWNQNLVKKDGNANEIGLRSFVTMIHALTDKTANLGKFGNEETRDSELEELIGTRVKIHVVPKTVGEYTNYTIKVRGLLENVYASNSNNELDTDDTSDEVPFDESHDPSENVDDEVIAATQPAPSSRVELKEGMKLAVTRLNKDGDEVITNGTCLQFIDAGEQSLIVCDPDRKDRKAFSFNPGSVVSVTIVKDAVTGDPLWNMEFVAQKAAKMRAEQQKAGEPDLTPSESSDEIEVDDIEDIEAEPEKEWEPVVKGAGAFTHPKLGRISGLIKSIDEDTGKAIITVNDKGYKVPLTKIEKP